MPAGRVMDVFISYSSLDKDLAGRLETDLARAKVDVWIDHDNIRGGGLLLDALQDAILNTRALALLWSQYAADSRYVKAEWQAAFHLEKIIIPCLIDSTDLPPFLLRLRFCDFRHSYDEGATALLEGLRSKPPRRPKPAPSVPKDVSRQELISAIARAQDAVLGLLVQREVAEAKQMQGELDSAMEAALPAAADDPMILNLAGYHKKNAYMIKHWDQIQTGQSPPDGLLEEAERFFFASLSIQPDDPSALNGLGSILLLRRDLDAAEFFVRRALGLAKQKKIAYPAAEQDLSTILRLKAGL